MRVGSLEATIIDIVGYLVPGTLLVLLLIHLIDPAGFSTLDFETWEIWGIVSSGYIAGHLLAAFQTQTIGRLSDRLFGHRRLSFYSDDGKLTWLGHYVCGVARVDRQSKRALQNIVERRLAGSGGESIDDPPRFAFDLGLQNLRRSGIEDTVEPRMRAFTILFGNLFFVSLIACVGWIIDSPPDGRNESWLWAIAILVCLLSFAASGRYRLSRVR